jgi:hypothetical protein
LSKYGQDAAEDAAERQARHAEELRNL